MKKIIHEDVFCDVIYSSRKITNPLKERYCSAMRGGFVWSIRTQCNYAAIRPQSRGLFSNMKKAFMPNGEKKHKNKIASRYIYHVVKQSMTRERYGKRK